MHFNSHRELDLCFRLINGSLIWYALHIPEVFKEPLSNYSRYAANLNMNAISQGCQITAFLEQNFEQYSLFFIVFAFCFHCFLDDTNDDLAPKMQ